MSIEKYLRVPMKIEQLIQLPREELRNYDLYVERDVDFFDDNTMIYLDDCIEEYESTGEEIYPPFSLEHNLRWLFFGMDVTDIITVDTEHPLQTPNINDSLENFIFFCVTKALINQFPQVEITDHELPYIVAGDFARYLLGLYKNNNMTELIRGLSFIEKLHHSKYHKVRELATIGYLEDIQNVWGNNGVDSELIFIYLGAESKKWWIELNKFWNREIKYVGETFENSD